VLNNDNNNNQTEPPLNAPENREQTAEIMVESFNIQGLYIAFQAVLALAASWASNKTSDFVLLRNLKNMTKKATNTFKSITEFTALQARFIFISYFLIFFFLHFTDVLSITWRDSFLIIVIRS
jgi:actin-related protein